MCWTLDRKVASHLNYLSWLEMYPIRSPKSIWRLKTVINSGYSLICCGCSQDAALIWSWCGSCLNWEEKTSWFHSEWVKTQNPSLVFQYTLSLSLLDTHIHFNLIPTHQLIIISWSWGLMDIVASVFVLWRSLWCIWDIIEFLFLHFTSMILVGLRSGGQLEIKLQILGLVHLGILKMFLKDSMLVIYFWIW